MKREGIVFWRVDLQKDFMNKDGALYVPDAKDAKSIKPKIEQLARLAIRFNIPLLGSYDWHPEDDPEFETFPPHCIQNTQGAEFIREANASHVYKVIHQTDEAYKLACFQKSLRDQYISYVVPKTSIDVFNEEFMDKHVVPVLKNKTIVIYGVATEYCVRAAVLGFLERGFKVIILSDVIKGVDPIKHGEALIEFQINGATVMKFSEFVKELRKRILIIRLRNHIREYLTINHVESMILGVSGGIDSAFTAAIVQPVAEELGIPLIGAWIGIESNTEEEHNRGMACGIEFCTEFIDMDFTHVYQHMMPEIVSTQTRDSDEFQDRVRRGNIKARLRMMYLYNLAHERNGMVLGTGNFTEFNLGFWTLHGDVGDFYPIANLYKTEVYALAQYLVEQLEYYDQEDRADTLQECINAVATDGLGISESDNEQLAGCSFEEIDSVLQDYLLNDIMSSKLNHPIVQKYQDKVWKRINPTKTLREELDHGSFF